MSNKLITQIKALFVAEAEATDTKVSLDVKTLDGRILRVSDVAVDATVVEITEDGEVALEDGTYTLEGDIQLVVLGGIITEVSEVTEEEVVIEDVVTEELSEETEDSSITEQLFMDVTLANGEVARVVTLTEGIISEGDILMVGDVEALVGDYVLDNGVILVVGDMGIISEIKEAVIEEEVVTEELDEVENKEITGVVNNLKELISQVKELKSQFDEVKKENDELKTLVSKFAGAPSATPTKTKVDFSKENKEERLRFFSQK